MSRSASHSLRWSASLLFAVMLAAAAWAEETAVSAVPGSTAMFEVSGQAITAEEFEQEALMHRAQVANEQAAANSGAAFGDDAVPVARVHAVTRSVLVRLAAERALFREYGVPFPADYAGLVASCERENGRRAEAVSRGGVIFGPKRFSVLAWRDYLHSNARIDVQRKLVAAGKLVIAAEELSARFRTLQAAGTIRAEATLDECRASLRTALIDEHYQRLIEERVHRAEVREIGGQ